MKSIILSHRGLKNVLNSALSGNNFTFLFGSNKIQLVNSYAEFISPKVSKMHLDDNTIDSISFDFNLDEYPDIFSDDVLLLLKKLSSGDSIEIDENKSFKFQIISLILGNNELLDVILEKFPDFINESNFDERLKYLELYHHFLKENKENKHHELIDYISGHFHSIPKEKLLRFPRSILYTIISNEHLKLESEDSLIDFIHQIFSAQSESEGDNNISINQFYSYVDFSELNEEALKTVLNRIDHKKMPIELWNRIRECFSSNIHLKNISTVNRYKFSRKHLEFNGDSTKSFEGIIAYLTKECNGNVHKEGVDVSASSVYSDGHHPKFAVDFNNHKFFCSKAAENSSICYDFKEKKIQPTFYSVEIALDYNKKNSTTHHHPKFWVIEGSNDKSNWKILDSRDNDNSFGVNNIVNTFKIQTHLSLNECFQYIRFRQTGKSSEDSDYLSFTSLEYFGYLYEF